MIVLLAGAEVYLIEENLAELRLELREHETINYASYNCDDSVNLDDIVALCNTLPFLGERRIIVVRNIHKIPVKHLQQLIDYLRDPSPSTTLILTVEGDKIPQEIRKAVSHHGEIMVFEPLKGRDLITWIQARSRRHGKEIDRDAAYLLNEVTGSNLWFMAAEIEKLSLYAGSRPTIELSDVEDLVVRSQEPSIFTFMDSLFDRKKDTLFRLYEIESSGVPELEIIKRIANQTILHYRLLFGNKEKKSDIHPFVEKKILTRKGTLSSLQLRSLLHDIRQMEHRVKTGMSVQPYVSLCETLGKFLSSEKI
ncbi:MAG: DNA polymerase III subunit delta [Desulfomonilia bacterium]|nr:DNA polymerase III subunit delta [Desulfomonilia bacterium]